MKSLSILLLIFTLFTNANAQTLATYWDKNAPAAKGLIGWWRGLQNYTNNVTLYDLLGVNHAVMSNFATDGVTSGWVSSSLHSSYKGVVDLRFDGSNDHANIAATTQLAPLAMSVFTRFKTSTFAEYGSIAVWRDSGGVNFSRAMYTRSSSDLAVYLITASGAPTYDPGGSSVLATNTWYHIGWTYDSVSGLIVYRNCQSIGTSAAAGTLKQSSIVWAFGYEEPTANNYLNGTLNDIRFYDYAVPKEMICRMMRESETGDKELFPPAMRSLGFVQILQATKSRFFQFMRKQ